jgi:hypothetical protein
MAPCTRSASNRSAAPSRRLSSDQQLGHLFGAASGIELLIDTGLSPFRMRRL